MTSRLTSKPRVPLFSSSLAAASVAIALSATGCGDGTASDAGIDGNIAPMPPPEDTGTPPRDGPMVVDSSVESVDAALVPMVDGSLGPVDAGELPPMPPPLDAAMEPDANVIAPMPPPMPPPMDPPPMPPPPPMPAPKS